jgi:hypothetical protein
MGLGWYPKNEHKMQEYLLNWENLKLAFYFILLQFCCLDLLHISVPIKMCGIPVFPIVTYKLD